MKQIIVHNCKLLSESWEKTFIGIYVFITLDDLIHLNLFIQ